MQYFKLNNGIMMPAIGSGTDKFGKADTNNFRSEVTGDFTPMDTAIEVGYRMFDTALSYENEDGIGRCLKNSGIPREEFFLMSKIPNRAPQNCTPTSVRASVEQSLRDLQTDYLDMYLIHKAVDDAVAKQGGTMNLEKNLEIWNTLTELYKEGKMRGIGVSNFDEQQLALFIADCGVIPMVNEIRCNPAHRSTEVVEFCKKNGIQPVAHSPLSFSVAPGVYSVDEDFKAKLSSIGEKYGKTWSHVQLRYNYQNGVTSIPRSFQKKNQAANIDIFDFELSADEMKALSE